MEAGSLHTGKKIIGITGGIGSGKSTVSKFIEELGFPVYDSDFWAKELVNLDENLKSKIGRASCRERV